MWLHDPPKQDEGPTQANNPANVPALCIASETEV